MPDVCSVADVQSRERRIGMHFSILKEKLPHSGTSASLVLPAVVLKRLCSDFVVRELSPSYNNGAPLVLEPVPVVGESACGGLSGAKRTRGTEDGPEVFPDEQCEKVLAQIRLRLAEALSTEDMESLLSALRAGADCVSISTVLTKIQRTTVHQTVRDLLGKTYLTRTEDGVLLIERATRASRREEDRRLNPRHAQKFLHFTLYKENMDSNRALREVAMCLGLPVRRLLFSGTKDKRAVTLQRVAVQGLAPDKLVAVNSRKFGPECKLKVCSFREMDFGLHLGDTLGNHFQIVLRLLPSSPEISAATLRQIEETIRHEGVVNYYGSQRFGTTDTLTSDVGVKLLSGEFEQAMRLVFRSKASVTPTIAPASEAFERGDYDKALHLLPRHCHQERDVLNHLVRFPRDFLGAFHKIPRTLNMLYCHAVQSLIWNEMASVRLAIALKPLSGDLVLKSRHARALSRARLPQLQKDEEAADLKEAFGFQEDDGLPEVVRLTDEEAASGVFNLTDILLTVPGPDEQLLYPSVAECCRESYLARLAALGAQGLLTTENTLVKTLHYHGTYRPLVVQPQKFSIRSCCTAEATEPILQTDLEALSNPTSHDHTVMAEGPSSDCFESKPHKAMVVEFVLPPGSYATCVLREFSVCCSEGYHSTGAAQVESEPLG
ncbi:hypothetical protein TRVL_05495 [Trypanosoma vivax]|nr:hypothetical protein TRVL_05495 [Trypanosoma vivax]